MAMEGRGAALVLLIHGTSAGDPADSGPRWWQRDSAFWSALAARLGTGFDCQPQGELFHWSGANSESERRAAGDALAARIEQLERSGRPYHLVGHSHGGSVLWLALLKLLGRRRDLPGLRSWTTIGTPFLHYRPRRETLWLLVPLVAALAALALSSRRIMSFGQAFREALQDPAAWLLPFGALPLLWSIFLGFAVFAALRLLAFVRAALKAEAERNAAEQVYRALYVRYLAVWCEADEAIGGLANTLSAEGAIVPRMNLRPRSVLGRLAAFAIVPVRAAYNGLIASASDEFVWDRVVRGLQGNDRFSYDLWAVTRHPVPSIPGWASLPPAIAEALVGAANEGAAATLAKMRNALGVAAEGGAEAPNFLTVARDSLNFRELVHNSYFDNDGLRELIALHIEAQGDPEAAGAPAGTALAAWLRGGYRDPERLAAAPAPKRDRRRLRTLPLLQGLLAVSLIGLVWTAAAGLHAAYVYPYTNRSQIDLVVNSDVALRIVSGSDINTAAIKDWGRALARAGFDSRAMSTASQIPATKERLIMLAAIAHEQLSARQIRPARATLDLARAAIARGEPESLDDGFRAVAAELAHLGRGREALAVVDRLAGDRADWRAEALGDVAGGHADAGRVDRALAILAAIRDPERRIQAIQDFIGNRGRGEAARLRAAALLARESQSATDVRRWRSGALGTAARVFGEFGGTSEALTMARLIPNADARTGALLGLAQELLTRGRADEARRLAEAALMGSPEPRAAAVRLFARLAVVQHDAPLMGRARALAARLDAASYAQMRQPPGEVEISALVSAWAAVGDVDRTLASLSRIPSFGSHEAVFDAAADAVDRLREAGRARELAAGLRTMPSQYHRCLALVALALASEDETRRDLLFEAEALAAGVRSDEEQSFALAKIAKGWIGVRQYRHGLALAERTRSFDRLDIYRTMLADHYDMD
jgi:hypothetical protein